MDAVIKWILRVFFWSLVVSVVIGVVIGAIGAAFAFALRFAPAIVLLLMLVALIWHYGEPDKKLPEEPNQ